MKTMIIGGGKVGTFLANYLHETGGHEIKMIELRRSEMPRLNEEIGADHIVLGSGTDPMTLESAGIRQMDVVAAVTGEDEVNLVVTNLARFEFNVPRTIARINNPKNAWMFTPDMGVDVALNQAELMGRLIIEEMSLGDMMTLLKLRKGQYSVVEEKVDPAAVIVDRPLKDIQLPKQCVLVAVIRRDGMEIPHGDLVFHPADEVIALVHSSQLNALADLLGPKK
jgi:trk system potassium uptake protein TrkA